MCNRPLPRVAAPAEPVSTPVPGGSGKPNPVDIERTKVREPVLAALFGLILPSLGALYNRKFGIALLLAMIEILGPPPNLWAAGWAG
jgi:hypothetical protein